MNADIDRLAEQLERATAPGPAESVELDDETRGLRESWLMLGQLLQAADAAESPPAVTVASLRNESPIRSTKLAWIAGCTLLSSLLAIALWNWNTTESPSTLKPAVAVEAGSDLPDEIASELAWDDEFDDRLASATSASFAFWKSTSVQQNHDERLSYLTSELVSISEELDDSTL